MLQGQLRLDYLLNSTVREWLQVKVTRNYTHVSEASVHNQIGRIACL
jgi:hypothetical protein